MADGRILLGVVGRPHGVRGLVNLRSYTADPADLAAYGALTDERGGRWTVVWRANGVAELRDASGRPLADRTAAEKLVNTRLYIDRKQLPPADEDEFYLADMIGLLAVDADGREFGRVDAVHDYGAGASLEIGPLLVPFNRACVPEVDVVGNRVVVVPPVEAAPSLHLLPPARSNRRYTVMAGLDPAIHAKLAGDVGRSIRKHAPTKGLRQVPRPVDAKVEPRHDDAGEA